jgi:hypothetical protein
MPREHTSNDKGKRFLRIRKIATLSELSLHLLCSPRTVQRRLSEYKAINSYNHNGRYYTLPDIPVFDAHGLWRYRDVFFSRHGNLPDTFVELVCNSPAGLTAAEAGERLGLRPSSFLWSLRDHPALKREKHQGIYVYMASESGLLAAQQQRRRQIANAGKITDAEAIAILVEKIKHPALSDKALSRRLGAGGLRIDPDMIGEYFIQHGLAVKKTPRLR